MAVDNEVPADLARGVPFYACPATQFDRLQARTDWLAEQRADDTILFVADLLRCRAHLKPADIELYMQLKPFAKVWPQIKGVAEFGKHCNEQAVLTGIVVPAPLRKKCIVHCTSMRITATRLLFAEFCNVSGCRAFEMAYLLS